MRRAWSALFAALVLLGAFAGAASGSIEVRPKRVAADANITFVLRIHSVWPDANTQAVKIQFPDEIAVPVFDAPPLGWSTKPLKAGNGDTVGVMYHGGIIPEGTHQDFLVAARTVTPGRTLWLAEQFYDNGVVARFSIDPAAGTAGREVQADGVAAVVQIVGNGPIESAVPAAPQPTEPPPASPALEEPLEIVSDDGGDGFGLGERLGLALLFVGLLAFVVVFVLSRTNAAFTPSQPTDTA